MTMGTLAKLVMGVAITAAGMFGADSLIGTWKWNPAKSKSNSANPLKSRTDVYEALTNGVVKVTSTRQLSDGTAIKFSYTFRYDGQEYPVTGAPYDRISTKRIDANTTFNDARKTDGAYHQTSQTVISNDGKMRTQAAKGTDASGKVVAETNIYERQ